MHVPAVEIAYDLTSVRVTFAEEIKYICHTHAATRPSRLTKMSKRMLARVSETESVNRIYLYHCYAIE